jgi:ligand-binding SRPBCC domain-containing protein
VGASRWDGRGIAANSLLQSRSGRHPTQPHRTPALIVAVIRTQTVICAPIERVFDLSRSVELHLLTSVATEERAVAGKTSGLLGMNDTITWEAKHLGVRQRLTGAIVEFERPRFFRDQMTRGAFHSLSHGHRFDPVQGGTVMTDVLEFRSTFIPNGGIIDSWIVGPHLERYLKERNRILKEVAESADRWREFIPDEQPVGG